MSKEEIITTHPSELLIAIIIGLIILLIVRGLIEIIKKIFDNE